MNEEEIIRLIRERDENGAGEFLRHYTSLMRYIIAPILPAQEDLEECLSDVVLRVWEKIDTYDPARGKWKTWLTALTRNVALNKARTLKSTESLDVLPQELAANEPSPEEAYLQQEQRRAIQRAIDKLPPRERILFYRKYYYLQSTEQIASELGMTKRAVEGKLYRIKKKLQLTLGGDKHE